MESDYTTAPTAPGASRKDSIIADEPLGAICHDARWCQTAPRIAGSAGVESSKKVHASSPSGAVNCAEYSQQDSGQPEEQAVRWTP
jgi:hypothetical protein